MAVLSFPWAADALAQSRTLSFNNVNTGETLTVEYMRDGRHVPEAMRRIDRMFRDWRRDEATRMDADLIDLIWEVHAELGSDKPIDLISGYRSPQTNEALRRRGGGQARRSTHTMGKAADVRFPDVAVKDLRNSALIRERGGVGFYPGSRIPFVHLDTGNVRHWPRLPRQELAELFPAGSSRHVPADGRPLTRRDGELAMARLRARGEAQRTQVAAATPPPAPVANPERAGSGPPPGVVMASLGAAPGGGAADGAQPAAPASRAGLADGRPRSTAMPAPVPSGGGFAMVDLGLTVAFEGDPTMHTGALERAQVAPAGGLDPEHPEELSYQPYPVLALMSEGAAAPRHALMEIVHPEQDRVPSVVAAPLIEATARFEDGRDATARIPGPRFTAPAVADTDSYAGLPEDRDAGRRARYAL